MNKAGRHRSGLGAWAEAKNRGSGGQRAELSGLRLRAGRGALAERLPSDEGTPRLEAPHLERLCGRPMFLALIFWLLLYQDKSNKEKTY